MSLSAGDVLLNYLNLTDYLLDGCLGIQQLRWGGGGADKDQADGEDGKGDGDESRHFSALVWVWVLRLVWSLIESAVTAAIYTKTTDEMNESPAQERETGMSSMFSSSCLEIGFLFWFFGLPISMAVPSAPTIYNNPRNVRTPSGETSFAKEQTIRGGISGHLGGKHNNPK